MTIHNIIRFILFLIAFTGYANVFAIDCGDIINEGAMNHCATTQFQQLDKELNKAYTEYIRHHSQIDKKQKKQLKDSQIAWVKFRDLSCIFESSGAEGSSIYPFILQSCRSDITRTRIKEFETLANCKEGDFSCPAWK